MKAIKVKYIIELGLKYTQTQRDTLTHTGAHTNTLLQETESDFGIVNGHPAQSK